MTVSPPSKESQPGQPPSLLSTATLDLLEEVIEVEHGEMKTYNDPPTQPQRPQVTYRGLGMNSNTKVDVKIAICAHGYSWPEEEEHKRGKRQPRTLLVVDYRVHTTNERRDDKSTQISSVKTEWAFADLAGAASAAQRPSEPTVLAIAPFHEETRWHRTAGEVTSERTVGGAAGAEQYAKVEGTVARTKGRAHEHEYFDSGKGYTEFNDALGRRDRAQWFLQQNGSQKLGSEPHFAVALLLGRSSDAPFDGRFDIRCGRGRWKSALEWAARTFGRPPRDDPVHFHPGRDPEGSLWPKYGSKIDLDNLDALVDEEELTGLVEIWERGMEPFRRFEEPMGGR